jgi:type II secretory pathway component PulC
MRHPLWILNSTLFFFVIAAGFFIVFSRQQAPDWESLEPSTDTHHAKNKSSEVNISKIYEYDLFDTYEKPLTPVEAPSYTLPLPEPPQPHEVEIPQEPQPQFLDPLKITLKGIIAVVNDDTKNRAIITDNKTHHETIYKVGDTLEDAQLIKIFNKKIVFLRANGQQEVVYLRQKDAQHDPIYATIDGWKGITQKVAENHYLVSIKEVARRVTSLAHFIDLLEITTVYEKGRSIGCRIGIISKDSLGAELGFEPHDIIVKVNDIAVNDSQDRLAVYKKIVAMQTKDTIIVQLFRKQRPLTLSFTLAHDLQEPSVASPTHVTPVVSEQVAQEQLKTLQERHKLAPTVREIRMQERENMLKKGKLPRNNLTSKFTEVVQ